MTSSFIGFQHHPARKLIFNIFFMPVFALKGAPHKGYRLYILFLPTFIKLNTESFNTLYGSTISSANAKACMNDMVKRNAEASDDFVCITTAPIKEEYDTRLIAFYLPQFHSIPLNDKHYGRGFTEWSNVTKAIPHFVGHHQPQLPIDTGFYDLAHDDVMYRQIELAKLYGIYGFCFHYYWFSGTRLLERPLLNFLSNKELNLPFCLCWANENWSTLWDGGNREVIVENKHTPEDCDNFFMDALPFLQDQRYIKIHDKPVLVIYKPQLLPDCKIWTARWRELAALHGLKGLYLVTPVWENSDTPEQWGVDALVEFPPNTLYSKLKPQAGIRFSNPKSYLSVLDMANYIHKGDFKFTPGHKLFKTVFPPWDNTARKGYSSANVYYGVTPAIYKKWLKGCIEWTREHREPGEQFVFVNAWNEWAEGAHLEPDTRYGYAYLQATKEALE